MADKPNTFVDGFSLLPDGMNSGIEPQLVPKTQTAMSTNATHRGGVIGNRPGVRQIDFDFQGNGAVQQRFENSLWQGGMFFKSEYGSESLVVSLGGKLFEVVPNPDASVTSAKVYERTIFDGANYDTNSAGVAVASMWQSERWGIINDNESLPIFFDGATARRSYGSSQDIGILFANFTIPAIGDSVDVTLAAPYTGPINYSVYVDDVFYQVNASISGPSVTLKNLSESGNPVQPSNTQLIIPSNLLSQTVDLQASGTSGGINVLLVKISDLPSPPLVLGEILTVRISGTNYVSAPIVQIFDPQRVYIGPVPVIPSCPALSPVYRGYFSSSAVAGVLASSFTSPAVSASGTAILQSPYYGTIPQKVVINGGLFEITASNNNPSLGNVINITNINDTFSGDTRGPTGTKGVGQFMTVPELPVGNVGQYGPGRNAMSLPDRRSFIESDLVGGSSGSPAYNFRDAVLKVTENEILFNGGSFAIPGNVGDIQSMTFPANLDTSLGQGPLQIGTPSKFFSCQVPVDRTVWQSMTTPLLTVSLSGRGSIGQYGTIAVNSDTYFRALNGIGSLILARRDFGKPGNVPISREMQRVIDADNIELLNHSTAVEFDNRLLMGCFPTQGPLGVYHQGIIALNLDPVSSLRGKAPEIYDGLWTGLQLFQLISGKFSGDERAFAFCFETFTNKIVLMELRQSGEDEFDNSSTPITWSFESASLFKGVKGKGDFDEVELMDGELWLSHIQGVVNVQTWYRPDYSECWIPWHSFSVCGTPNNPKQYRTRVGLGEPDVKQCDPTTNRPFRIGATFQIRCQITGACKVRGGILKATSIAEPYWAPQICTPLCDENSSSVGCEPCKEQGNCLRFDLVFYNINGNKTYANDAIAFPIECPNGTTETVVIPAGEIVFTLPFPPEYNGEYPPLVMGCAAGGRIVRQIPSGSSQEAIDDIVREMMNTCAEALAQSRAQCSGGSPKVSNAEVYFDNPCEEGELTYIGTLPSWITLDTINQRLVGAAGTFEASTQAEADGIAQSALDSFGNNAVTSGDLMCSTNCTVVPTETLNNALASAAALAFASGSNLALVNIDNGTTTTLNTYDCTAGAFAASGSLALGASRPWMVGHINIAGTRYWVGFSSVMQRWRRMIYNPIANDVDVAAAVTGPGSIVKSIACNNTTGFAYACSDLDLAQFNVSSATAGAVFPKGTDAYHGQLAVDENLDRVLVLRRTAGGSVYVSVRRGSDLVEISTLALPVTPTWPVGIAFSNDLNKFAVAANDGNADGGDVVYIYDNYVLVATIRLLTAYWTSTQTYLGSASYNAETSQACFVVTRTGPVVGGMRFICLLTNADAGFADTTAIARISNTTVDDLNNRPLGSGFGRIQGFTYPP